MIGKKYHANLHSDVPLVTQDWTPKRYISKIRFWCYERYAKHVSLPWGKGQDAHLPRCIKAKIRMTFRQPARDTFRQPARDIDEWIREPFIYQLHGLSSTLVPYGDATGTVLGKRSFDNM